MTLPKNKKLPKKGGKVPQIFTDGAGPKGPKGDLKGDMVKPGDGKKGDGKGKGKGGKGKGKGFAANMPKLYGGRGGYDGVKTKTVRRLVNGVLRDEMRDLRGQMRMQRRDANQARRDANRDYRRGRQDLRYVHGETADYIGNLTQRTAAGYADQATQSQQAQAALQAMLGQTYSGAQGGAESELARLGILGGGNMAQLQADQMNAQGVAAQSGANAQSTLGMAGANSAAGMSLLAGMNQGSHMQGIGQNLNARNDALAEIRGNRIDNTNEIRRAMQDAKSSRRDLFFQLLQQLQQTGWDQYIQQQQLQLQRKALNKD